MTTSLADRVRKLGADIYPALEQLSVPVIVIDASGHFVYVNDATIARFGDVRGHLFTTWIAPESLHAARESFARKILGVDAATETELTLVDKDGNVLDAEVSAVALESDGHVVGVFGLVEIRDVEQPLDLAAADIHLTARQAEVLRHLGAGCSTDQIAKLMGIGKQTVRNHVRAVLRQLGAHSRLEAVLRAHELGLLHDRT